MSFLTPPPSTQRQVEDFLLQMMIATDAPPYRSRHGSNFCISPQSMFIKYSPLIHDQLFARRKKVEEIITSYLYPIISQEDHYFPTLRAAEIIISFDRFDCSQFGHINRFIRHLGRLPNLELLTFHMCSMVDPKLADNCDLHSCKHPSPTRPHPQTHCD